MDEVDFSVIVKQYMMQIATLFLAGIKEKMSAATSHIDDWDIMGALEDFRSGFDRRLSLITINHVLLNLDKSIFDGSLFMRLLNVKNTAEWLSLTENIRRDHFQIKNHGKYDEMANRLVVFCQVSKIIFYKKMEK